jgi:hypothetical protein
MKGRLPWMDRRLGEWGRDLGARQLGIRDVISEATTDFSNTAAWEAKRRAMAKGVHGSNRLGGNSAVKTMVFGRIAGRAAAQYKPVA